LYFRVALSDRAGDLFGAGVNGGLADERQGVAIDSADGTSRVAAIRCRNSVHHGAMRFTRHASIRSGHIEALITGGGGELVVVCMGAHVASRSTGGGPGGVDL